jgi:hypothetical protein
MATTISGTTVTFTDGSTWGGANGALTPDGNTSRTSQDFNIGHIVLANCIFLGNQTGFVSGGRRFWALNTNNQYYSIDFGYANTPPAVNTTASFPVNDPRHGSQSYFALGSSGSGLLTGTWKNKGMACGAGINQTNGYFVLLERVA